jgi:GT2 family glycosyltransferase
MKKIVVSIINFNGNTSTLECLDSLKKTEKKSFELYVRIIDNHSKSPFILDKKKYESINASVFISPKNLGFSGGHNLGIAYAKEIGADYVMILNNDTTVDPQLIEKLSNELEKKKNAVAVVPKIYFTSGQEYHQERYSPKERGKVIWYAGGKMDWNNLIGYHVGVDEVDSGQFDTISETEFATGACVMIPLAILEKSGTFDEQYFLYYEDNDLCMRLKKFGKIYFVPSAVVWHDNAGSTGGSGSQLQDYFISRNRMLFGMRYAPTRTKIALIRESINYLFTGREWQKKGARDFYLRRLGKGSYPVGD